jgi:hypothetical protein
VSQRYVLRTFSVLVTLRSHICDIIFFFILCLPQDGRKRPKHVADLLYECILFYLNCCAVVWINNGKKTSVTLMLFPAHDICTAAAANIWYKAFLYVFWCVWYVCLPTNSPYILDCCWSAMAESCWTHRKSSTLPMWSIPAMHPMWWVHIILAYMSPCLKMRLVLPPVTYSKLSVRGVLFLLRAVT